MSFVSLAELKKCGGKSYAEIAIINETGKEFWRKQGRTIKNLEANAGNLKHIQLKNFGRFII